jgi:hypothetical protein
MTRSLYVIKSEPGPVKIGITSKPKGRLSELQTASFVPLFLRTSANALKSRPPSREWFQIALS